MGQRARILAQVVGFHGWRVTEAFFEGRAGERVEPVGGLGHASGGPGSCSW